MAITGYLERGGSAGEGRSVSIGKNNFAQLNKNLKEKGTRAVQYQRQASTPERLRAQASDAHWRPSSISTKFLSPFTAPEGPEHTIFFS